MVRWKRRIYKVLVYLSYKVHSLNAKQFTWKLRMGLLPPGPSPIFFSRYARAWLYCIGYIQTRLVTSMHVECMAFVQNSLWKNSKELSQYVFNDKLERIVFHIIGFFIWIKYTGIYIYECAINPVNCIQCTCSRYKFRFRTLSKLDPHPNIQPLLVKNPGSAIGFCQVLL